MALYCSNGKEQNRIKCRIEEINLKISKLIDTALESNDITTKYLNDKISELEAEHQTLKAEVDKFSCNRRNMLAKEICDMEDEWGSLDIPQKNRIASLLISRIDIAKDKIEIHWNYDFDIN